MNYSQVKSNPIKVHIVNAFISQGGGGNPAGVVLSADTFSDEQMLLIASQVGLSETVFVSASETEGVKLDFFTPTRRIAHCGHATIAAFSYLSQQGLIGEGETSKETVDGPRKIVLKQGTAFMEQKAPDYLLPSQWGGSDVTLSEVLHSVGLKDRELDPDFTPSVVNTGNSFLLIGVKSGEVLQKLEPDYALIAKVSDKLNLVGYYVFTTDPKATDKDATTRMFAPRYGIEEESATGMAAGPLACLLYDAGKVKTDTVRIEQGVFMSSPSPSLIDVELNLVDGTISSLMAGGKGKPVKHITVDV